MALQGYADHPCPQWDTNPPRQYMSWPRITPDSRCLNSLGHHDQDNIFLCATYTWLYMPLLCFTDVQMSFLDEKHMLPVDAPQMLSSGLSLPTIPPSRSTVVTLGSTKTCTSLQPLPSMEHLLIHNMPQKVPAKSEAPVIDVLEKASSNGTSWYQPLLSVGIDCTVNMSEISPSMPNLSDSETCNPMIIILQRDESCKPGIKPFIFSDTLKFRYPEPDCEI